MQTKHKTILISLIPAIIFLIAYKFISFKHAVIIGFFVGVVIYIGKYNRNKKLNSFDYLGIFGLLSQTIIGCFAQNPKTYFIYPLIENIIYAIVFGISLIMNKDVISYIAKDLTESKDIFNKCKPAFRTITYFWTIFFLIKVIIKLIGISSWSFELIYSINWLLGTPVSLVLLWFSFSYPDKYYNDKYSNHMQ